MTVGQFLDRPEELKKQAMAQHVSKAVRALKTMQAASAAPVVRKTLPAVSPADLAKRIQKAMAASAPKAVARAPKYRTGKVLKPFEDLKPGGWWPAPDSAGELRALRRLQEDPFGLRNLQDKPNPWGAYF